MNHEPLIVSLKKSKRPEEIPATNPTSPAPTSSSFRPARKRRPLVPIIIICALILAGGMWYFDPLKWRADDADTATSEQDVQAATEAAELIEKIGRLIVLPEGEEPTVATVTDPSKLKDQTFFAQAKTGHKVLIYAQARKAFLYDPEIDKLVEVAPIAADIQ